MAPGRGGTKVVEVVLVVELVVVVVGTVVAVGSPGTVTTGDVVSVGGAVTGVKQSVPGRYKRIAPRGLAGGVGKKVAGWPTSAASMVAFQIRDGNVPPTTLSTPTARNSGILTIGKYRSGWPTHTAVTNSGVYPTIHEFVLLSWVPVFAAATRPSSALRRAVPETKTPDMMVVVLAAAYGVSTATPSS
jgi:hypothetical protein